MQRDPIDPDSPSYLQAWSSQVQERDFEDGADNDRYHDGDDVAAQATAAAEAAQEKVRRAVETAETEVEGWYEGVKRWLKPAA